jgi:hypothetical protein
MHKIFIHYHRKKLVLPRQVQNSNLTMNRFWLLIDFSENATIRGLREGRGLRHFHGDLLARHAALAWKASEEGAALQV